MWWLWKLLGYKDEEKAIIKKYQLEKAKEHFTKKEEEELSQKQKDQKKPYPKSYAEAVKKEKEIKTEK